MKKIQYFGVILLIFGVLLVVARQYDLKRARETLSKQKEECLGALSKSEERYLQAIEALFPTQTKITSIAQRYKSSSVLAERAQIFEELLPLTAALTAQADASNPALRVLLDEAAGAMNRRKATQERCQLEGLTE
jgi:hypothetical protein